MPRSVKGMKNRINDDIRTDTLSPILSVISKTEFRIKGISIIKIPEKAIIYASRLMFCFLSAILPPIIYPALNAIRVTEINADHK